MAITSAIEWTDATWNPITGCTKISSGCDNCYAERFSERFRGVSDHPFEDGFDLTLRPERLDQPIKWRRAKMIFVNSMSDLFHKDVPWSFIDRVFETMETANWHTYQILTKRSTILQKYINLNYNHTPVPPHIWVGTSIEDSARKSRIRHIQQSNASIRFISIEPLIDQVGILDLQHINWVIVGGESGPNARPMNPDWVRNIRDQCIESGVSFFFKQWGGLRPKSGGRTLDGQEWNQMPLNRATKGVLKVAAE